MDGTEAKQRFLAGGSRRGLHTYRRSLKVTYKSAWFIAHRIRYCMGQSPLKENLTGIVEADETYVGGKEKNKPLGKRERGNLGGKGKAPIVSLVQRDGTVRSFAVDKVTMGNLRPIASQSPRCARRGNETALASAEKSLHC